MSNVCNTVSFYTCSYWDFLRAYYKLYGLYICVFGSFTKTVGYSGSEKALEYILYMYIHMPSLECHWFAKLCLQKVLFFWRCGSISMVS